MGQIYSKVTIKKLLIFIVSAFALKLVIEYALKDSLISFFALLYQDKSDAYAIMSAYDIVHNMLVAVELSTLVAFAWIIVLFFNKRQHETN